MSEKITRQQLEEKLLSKAFVRKTSGKRKKKLPPKVCGFCWKSYDSATAEPVFLDGLGFLFHPSCKTIWNTAQDLILSGNLYHGVRYSDDLRRNVQPLVDKFLFRILQNYAPEVLIHSQVIRRYLD